MMKISNPVVSILVFFGISIIVGNAFGSGNGRDGKGSIYRLKSQQEVIAIAIEFHESAKVRVRNGRLKSLTKGGNDRTTATSTPSIINQKGTATSTPPNIGGDISKQLSNIATRIQTKGLEIRRSVSGITESQLDRWHHAGKARGSAHETANLNSFYRIPLPKGSAYRDAESLISRLSRNPVIKQVYAVPKPDFPHHQSTPNLVPNQVYRDNAPIGIGIDAVWNVAGAKGNGVKIVDIEGQWNANHEDLPNFFFNDGPSTITDSHGTAVVGIISGKENGIGVTGITPNASIGVKHYLNGGGTPNAILTAANLVGSGGIVLIELHYVGPDSNTSCNCSGYQCDYVPVEWLPAEYNAIKTATNNGVIVVEAAGNGYTNLDNSVYGNKFNRNVYDSGAIMVGASNSGSDRTPACYSNHGSRVDVHGWGFSVTTTGYGYAFDGGHGAHGNQSYTNYFSGTSSASPIVVGAAASVQGVRIANGLSKYNSVQMRSLLSSTGTAQTGDFSVPIGPLPDIERALEQLGLYIPPHFDYAFTSATVSDALVKSYVTPTLTFTLKNTGNIDAPEPFVKFYRSTDSQIDSSDTYFSTGITNGVLSGGATITLTTQAIHPAGEATYYYGACVDTEPGERYPNNNCTGGVKVVFNTDAATIGEAVDNDNYLWQIGGTTPFDNQTTTYYYGGDAAQSGSISDNQSSYFQATFKGEGKLTFYWKTSSEPNWDKLKLYVDNMSTAVLEISGETGWQKVEYDISSGGNHLVRWAYEKDNSQAAGQDKGWVDKITFVDTSGFFVLPNPNGAAVINL